MSLKTSRIPTWSQLKKVSSLLSSRERRILGVVSFILVISIGAWGYAFYKENIITVPTEGGVWSEALIGQPVFINPILAQTSDADLDLSRLIYRGLLRYNESLVIEKDLAADFIIDENGTKYTFIMRDDAFWQDGTLVTVDDVIFTIHAIQDSEWQSPLLVSFKGITVDKINENTIVFNLPEPFGPFLSLLTVGILPKHIWQDIPSPSARLAEFNIKPIGNGPWRFNELVKERSGTIRSYSLVPNEFYTQKKPYLSEMVFKFYPDFNAALSALNQNQVMGLSFLPTDLAESVTDSQKYSFHTLNLPQYTALFFNQKQNELLKSKAIRTALARAIDKHALVDDAIQSQAEPITSPLLNLEQAEVEDPLSFDPERSKTLLSEDGWITGDNGFLTKGDANLSVTITTVNHSENTRVVNAVKEAWERLGIQTTIRLVSPSEIQSTILKNRDFEILLYGAIIGADPDPFPFWHSTQAEHPGLNLSQFRDINTDTLLEAARQEKDPLKRSEAYSQFRAILHNEVPAIFLYTPTYTYLQEKRLQGFAVTNLILPADRLNGTVYWYTKTKRTLKK